MEKTYARLLENREINDKTGKIWAIQDVPKLWRKKTTAKVEADGYYFDEDGTAYPNEPNEDEDTEE